jgi:Ni,Fe-hydrogenase I cytochrome b subunit
MSGMMRPGGGRPRGNAARGLMLLAYGNPEGFTEFGSDPAAYLASLAPLVGFLLVYGGQVMITDTPMKGAAAFLAYLISLLAPPVLAEPFCRRWDRLGAWGLYANMLNWAQILLIGAALVAVLVAMLLVAAGLELNVAAAAAGLGVLIYAAWLQWFTARCTLDLTRWQTVKLLLATQLGTGVLIVVPSLVGMDFPKI